MKVFIVTFVAVSVLIANGNCNAIGGGVAAELISAPADGGCGGGWGGAADAGWAPAGGHGGSWGGAPLGGAALIDAGPAGCDCGGCGGGALLESCSGGLGGGLGGALGGGLVGGLGGGDLGGAALVNAGGCGGGSTDLYRVYGQPIQVSPEATSIVVPASPVIIKPVLISQGAPVSINPTILTKSAPAQVSINPVAIKLLRQTQRAPRTLVVQAPSGCGCGIAGCGGGH